MANTLTKTSKQIEKIKVAQGITHAVIVGVATYKKGSGYNKLSQCKNDAIAVHRCFEDTHQLNAPKEYLRLMLDPSKGDIVSAVKELAVNADDEDRVFFFFSGHGERINERFFLVPADAWSSEEPEALLDFEVVKSGLSGSRAKHKIVMLDACFSGPNTTTFKRKPAAVPMSKAFLLKVLEESSGTVIVSSSSDSESSTTKSPDSNYSLFTYYLLKCLRGEPAALEDDLLTSDSLFKYLGPNVMRYSKSCGKTQTPVKSEVASGFCFIFGDFSLIVSTETLSLGENSSGISFYDEERLRTDDILPTEGIDHQDFDNLTQVLDYYVPRYYEDDLGQYRANLKKALSAKWGELEIEGQCLYFPDGSFQISFSSDGVRYVTIKKEIFFDREWYQSPERILSALDLIDLDPVHVVIHLKTEIKLEDFADDIESHGWTVDSFTNSKIVARYGARTAVITSNAIDFKGFAPADVLKLDAPGKESEMISAVYTLVEHHKAPLVPRGRGRK